MGGPRAQPKMSASHDSRCDSGGGRGGGAELGLGRAKRPPRGGGRVAISRSDRVFLRGTARVFPFLSEISFPSAFPAVPGAVFRGVFPVFRRFPRFFFHSRLSSPPHPPPTWSPPLAGLHCPGVRGDVTRGVSADWAVRGKTGCGRWDFRWRRVVGEGGRGDRRRFRSRGRGKRKGAGNSRHGGGDVTV